VGVSCFCCCCCCSLLLVAMYSLPCIQQHHNSMAAVQHSPGEGCCSPLQPDSSMLQLYRCIWCLLLPSHRCMCPFHWGTSLSPPFPHPYMHCVLWCCCGLPHYKLSHTTSPPAQSILQLLLLLAPTVHLHSYYFCLWFSAPNTLYLQCVCCCCCCCCWLQSTGIHHT
jgi:hypothetical protein